MNLTKIQNTAKTITDLDRAKYPLTMKALEENSYTAQELENIRGFVALAADYILDDKEYEFLKGLFTSPQAFAGATAEDRLTGDIYLGMIYSLDKVLLAAHTATIAAKK